MSRFTDVISKLRIERAELVKENRAKKARRGGSKKKKSPRKMSFDSPELEAIFNGMPEECKDLIRKGK